MKKDEDPSTPSTPRTLPVIDTVDIGAKGTMKVSAGVMQLSWEPGITVELDDALGVLSAIATLSQGATLPLLIDLHEVTHSSAARKIFPAPSTVSRIALLGSSAVDHAVAMFRLGNTPLPYPVQYFTSREQALQWLAVDP